MADDVELATENVANPCEAPENLHDRYGNENLFLMWICANRVYVWASSFEDAFEKLVEWADEHERGCLVDITMDDVKEAADHLGIPWNDRWENDWDLNDPDFAKAVDEAESDLTIIGHTSLKGGNYVPSDEWGGGDVTDDDEIEAVARHSRELCDGFDFLVGDVVWYDDPAADPPDDDFTGRYVVIGYDSDNTGKKNLVLTKNPDSHYRDELPAEPEYLEHFDPAIHAVKPKRFRTKDAWQDDDSFDGLNGINDDDTYEESFRTPDGIRVHLFVFYRGGSAGHILTVERPKQKPQVFRGSTPGDLHAGVVAGRRLLIQALSRKRSGGLMGLFGFGRRR